MGSIVNGIALEPAILKPYGSTFLIFSDYMRPAVRLSALMGVETMWVWTHDSVGLGEDGPTHRPVEHHMSLRAMPEPLVRASRRRERDVDGGESHSSAAAAPSRSRCRARSCRRSTAPRWPRPTVRCAGPTRSGSRVTASPT